MSLRHLDLISFRVILIPCPSNLMNSKLPCFIYCDLLDLKEGGGVYF